jgi:integrase
MVSRDYKRDITARTSTMPLSDIWSLEYNTVGHRSAAEGSAGTMITDRWTIQSRRGGWTYKIHGFVNENRGVNFTLHRIGPKRWRVSGHSMNGSRLRVRFYAEDLEDALKVSEKTLGYVPPESANTLRIAEVFARWEQTLNCNAGSLRGYRRSIKVWLAWADTQSLQFWLEIRLEHLQRYATYLVSSGYSEDTLKLMFYPIRSAVRWAAANWPGEFANVAVGFRLPKVKRNTYEAETNPALSLIQAAKFVIWIESQRFGHRVVLGVALQALAGLRITEVIRLTWDKFEGDTVVVEGETKNNPSLRRIPLPKIVLDLINDYRTAESGMVYPDYTTIDGYTKHVRRLLKAQHIQIPVKDLRNTLPTEFRAKGHHGYIFERYIGHAATSITDKHYVTLGEAERLQLMRDQVVKHIDDILGDLCHKRHNIGTMTNVVALQ